MEQLFGYSEEEWIGQHARMIFTPAEKAEEVCEAEMGRTGVRKRDRYPLAPAKKTDRNSLRMVT